MSKEQNFLVKYGLHNFVTWSQTQNHHTFIIKNLKNQDLVSHAQYLIKESFGDTADIRIV